MPLRLKTKFTLTTALLVLTVATLISTLYVAALVRQAIHQLDERARFVASQVLLHAQHSFEDAASRGEAPASSSAQDLQAYVRKTLEGDAGLNTLLQGAVGYSPTIYEVTITDPESVALVSSDDSLPGHIVLPRAKFDTFAQFDVLEQLRVLYGPPRIYDVSLPFNLGDEPYGEIHVGLISSLLRNEISPALRSASLLALAGVLVSTVLAGAVSSASLAPLQKISAQLDRIAKGEFDSQPVRSGDELGQVSTKISQIGQQLRGVREIFSSLRENLSQLTSGLEDGLLLFSSDGRTVFASPSVEKFLGARPDTLLGRRVSEVFAPGTPLASALRIEGDHLAAVEGVEAQLNGASGPRRVGASVRVIAEGGSRMGALVALRDLDSLERIGSQLEISERLAALGRVTAGVAHEVKNPLNSMRLWLENLRESLPGDPESAQTAIKILDSEIDRLDRVVKTFLDFTRPVELHLEETDLGILLSEVVATAQPQVQKAGVQVTVDRPDHLPAVLVDRQLFKQALLNLMLNACEAMSAGGRLTLAVRRRGEQILLSVSDTGRGIPPENRRRIFELFFSTRPGGTGLGLATAFRIVQLHRGSIDFQSEVGRGTTFSIELPLAHGSTV